MMISFKKDEFTSKGLRIIRRAFSSDKLVNFYTILLVGQLDMPDLKEGMYRFIKKENMVPSEAEIWYKSKEWAAHLALAKIKGRFLLIPTKR